MLDPVHYYLHFQICLHILREDLESVKNLTLQFLELLAYLSMMMTGESIVLYMCLHISHLTSS